MSTTPFGEKYACEICRSFQFDSAHFAIPPNYGTTGKAKAGRLLMCRDCGHTRLMHEMLRCGGWDRDGVRCACRCFVRRKKDCCKS